jgi:hypothetical protein
VSLDTTVPCSPLSATWRTVSTVKITATGDAANDMGLLSRVLAPLLNSGLLLTREAGEQQELSDCCTAPRISTGIITAIPNELTHPMSPLTTLGEQVTHPKEHLQCV